MQPRKKHIMQIQMHGMAQPRNSQQVEHLQFQQMSPIIMNTEQFAQQVNARPSCGEDPITRKNFMFDTTSTFLPHMNRNSNVDQSSPVTEFDEGQYVKGGQYTLKP